MKEKGVIEEVVGEKATIRVMKTGACAGCLEKSSCHMRLGGEKPIIIDVDNHLGAKAGDFVELAIPTRNLLKLSFAVYVLPVLAFVLAAVIGSEWGHLAHLSPDVASIVFGGSVLLVSFLLLKRLDRSIRRKGQYYPRMTRIVAGETCERDNS
jgi:sigma-E factor negative regulatory protein RseC